MPKLRDRSEKQRRRALLQLQGRLRHLAAREAQARTQCRVQEAVRLRARRLALASKLP